MKAILHIGQSKTGSSNLQYFLERNRKKLIEKGLLYPESLGRKKHVSLLKEWPQLNDESSSVVSAFRAEIKKHPGCTTHILSEENLFVCKPEKKKAVSGFLGQFYDEIEIVVYLQRQEQHMPGHYQKLVNGKGVLTFEEWIKRMVKVKNNYYCYDKALTTWVDLLPQAKIHIVPFCRIQGARLFDKILEIAGLNDLSDFNYDIPILKESIDPRSTELFRIINCIAFKNDKNLDEGFREKLRRFLSEKPPSDPLKLTLEQLEYVYTETNASNRAFVEKFNIEDDSDKSYFLDRLPANTELKEVREEEVLSLLVEFIGTIN